jgi:hypothetical protein
MKIKLLLVLLFNSIVLSVYSQYSYGTVGLLNMPTADMERDKTFILGGSFLDSHTSTSRWFYNTYNYYVNITFFPWLEVAYDCTLHKAVLDDYGIQLSGYWVPSTFGKFANQDRNFAVRLRVWKEGWWKPWTPQIVIGGNDAIHNSWESGSKIGTTNQQTNGFLNRYYISVTKHFDFNRIGQLGAHVSYLYNDRDDYPLNGLALGVNFRFQLPEGECVWNKVLNGLDVMAEAYPADGRGYIYKNSFTPQSHLDRGVAIGKYDINIGMSYSIWKDHINLIGELYGCKDFSGGVQFKVHL